MVSAGHRGRRRGPELLDAADRPALVLADHHHQDRLALHRPLTGPRDTFVAAQAEGMPGRVGVDLPAFALGTGEIPLQRRAELDDAALLGLDFAHFEVEVVLLGVFVAGPAWTLSPPISRRGAACRSTPTADGAR